MERYFKIGDFSFKMKSDIDLLIPAHFGLFETGEIETDYTYSVVIAKELPEVHGTVVHHTHDITVLDYNGLETRQINIYGESSPYAQYLEKDAHNAEIYIAEERLEEILKYDTTFTSLFALEKKMAERNALILHSSSIHYGDEAVLFSAPSGTGKSTQADQWKKYRGNTTINGDRNLLAKYDGRWHMLGWPVCGSSEICHNEKHPVKAIVMLEQAKTDSIVRLNGMQAYSRVFPQITCGRWDKKKALHVMDLTEKLISEVPVFLLKCTISENAVLILENELEQLKEM